MSLDIVYYSNRSGNTKRFANKLGIENTYSVSEIPVAYRDYVLFVPTYGAGNEGHHVPKPVKSFLSIKTNQDHLVGVVGFGNTNFGKTYCKAADIISKKFGVPVLGRVELFGTPEDVSEIQERLRKLNDKLQLP
jgi:protein involved in ribonucleotide reduction